MIAIPMLLATPAGAEAACVRDPMTTAERSLASIFGALDDLGRAAYDAAMPGDAITFRRANGRWRANVPPHMLRRARANGCDIVANVEEAAAFYGPSLDLSGVRILAGGPVMEESFAFHDRVKIGADADACPPTRLLVHELAHVWQYQHGQWQATMGLADQTRYFWTDVYALQPDRVIAAARAGRPISSFIRERQAELFETAWLIRTGRAPTLDPAYARAVLALVEPARRAPPTWGVRR